MAPSSRHRHEPGASTDGWDGLGHSGPAGPSILAAGVVRKVTHQIFPWAASRRVQLLPFFHIFLAAILFCWAPRILRRSHIVSWLLTQESSSLCQGLHVLLHVGEARPSHGRSRPLRKGQQLDSRKGITTRYKTQSLQFGLLMGTPTSLCRRACTSSRRVGRSPVKLTWDVSLPTK